MSRRKSQPPESRSAGATPRSAAWRRAPASHGGDPNWGRLLCAAGRASVALDASRAAVTIGSLVLFKDGQPHDELAPAAADYLKGTDLTIGVDLGSGSASSTVWTCDLSAEYVRINADYRT